jgi:hypothetical protein
MFVTTRRLLFVPPMRGWLCRLVKLIFYLPLFNFLAIWAYGWYPPLTTQQSFELKDLIRLWTWTPHLSGPPAFQIGKDTWSFELMDGRDPAPKDRVEEHLHVVETVWLEASKVLEAFDLAPEDLG